MSTILSDERTTEIAKQKTKGTKEDKENKSSEVKKHFAHMLIEFNVIPYIIGFAIAVVFADLTKTLGEVIVKNYFKRKKHDILLVKFLTFLLVILFCYLFGYLIFYKFLYTPDIAKETIIKKAINEKKEEEIKREIENDPHTQYEIQKTAQIRK
jgi:hypothetical protein